MLWTDAKTKPPPGARSAIRRATSARTSAGVPAAEDALRVHAAAPEDEVPAELALELGRVHPRGGDLDRVEDVDPDLDEVGEQLADRPAGVEQDLRPGPGPDEREELRVERLHELAVRSRREERRRLAAEVVRLADDVDGVAELREDRAPPGELHLEDALHERPGEGVVRGEVHVAVLEAAEAEQHLGEPGADRADEDAPALVGDDPAGRLGDAARAGRDRRRRARQSEPGGRRRSRRPAAPSPGRSRGPPAGIRRRTPHSSTKASSPSVSTISRRQPPGARGSTPRTSIPSRSSTSSSTTASCCETSAMRTSAGGRPSARRRPGYARAWIPVIRTAPRSRGTRSGSRWSRAVRSRSRRLHGRVSASRGDGSARSRAASTSKSTSSA